MFRSLRALRIFRGRPIKIISTSAILTYLLSNRKPNMQSKPPNHLYSRYSYNDPNNIQYHFKSRSQHLQEAQNTHYDVIIVGGGATASGIALECSQRGLRSLVVEQDDFAAGASSKSTKLVHGGVRYLQQVFDWNESNRLEKLNLVIEALKERSTFLKLSQTHTKPLPILIPCDNVFQAGYYYMGQMLYYLIYRFYSEKNSFPFNAPRIVRKDEIQMHFKNSDSSIGVLYEDGQFNDSRMNSDLLLTSTLENYHEKASSYSNILNYCEVRSLKKDLDGKLIGVEIHDRLGNKSHNVYGHAIVNATGCFADKIRQLDNPQVKRVIVPSGGSHMILPGSYCSRKWGYLVPKTNDGRVLFILPWKRNTLIGTTEKKFNEPILNPTVSHQELSWMIRQVAEQFPKENPGSLGQDVKSKWCGLRPLVIPKGYDPHQKIDTKEISRNHVIEVSNSGLISVMGGKWTIYRQMGEDAVNRIEQYLKDQGVQVKVGKSISKDIRLVGDFDRDDQQIKSTKRNYYMRYALQLREDYGLQLKDAKYFVKNYGDRSFDIQKLSESNNEYRKKIDKDLPHTVGELVYLIRYEMAMKPQDIIFRRTRLGFLDGQKIKNIYGLIVDLYGQEYKMSKEQKQQFYNENLKQIEALEY